jgi:hexosaminidase
MPRALFTFHPLAIKSSYWFCRAALFGSLFVSAALSASAQSTRCPFPLIPCPREITLRKQIPLSKGISVVIRNPSSDDQFAAKDFLRALKERGVPEGTAGKGAVVVQLLRTESSEAKRHLLEAKLNFSPEQQDEGYVLISRASAIEVIAKTPAGIFYGLQTLKQLVQGQHAAVKLQLAQIRDWPAMRYRGVDSDLSRGPIATVEFQKAQVRTLAAYKINIYSPYFEHTFAYTSTPLQGLPGGVITTQEARELVDYAARYHVMIIPQQEAFGHLHRFLSYEQNSELAETPLGMVLAPGQKGSLAAVKAWFEELAKVFPAPFSHIGADETSDLGVGQSAAQVRQNGRGAVYVTFVKQIHSVITPLHKRVLFWGDMAMNELQQLVDTLPKDMIAVAWHYSPEPNGFDRWLLPYKRAGIETWVAPGANNWGQIYPNNELTLQNVQEFVRDGQRLGSTGMLMTEWRDDGEGLFSENWYGAIFSAAASWQSGPADIDQFQEIYGPVFHGDYSGHLNDAQRELIACHKVLEKAGVGDETVNLFWLDPWSPTGLETGKKLLPFARELRLHAERALTLIAALPDDDSIRNRNAIEALTLGARRFDFLAFKFQSAFAILEGYNRALQAFAEKRLEDVDRELWTITGSDGRCDDLQQGYNYIRNEYRDLWQKENRAYWLENVLDRYDVSAQLWWKRSAMFADVQSRWNVQHTLPSPEQLDLPKFP